MIDERVSRDHCRATARNNLLYGVADCVQRSRNTSKQRLGLFIPYPLLLALSLISAAFDVYESMDKKSKQEA